MSRLVGHLGLFYHLEEGDVRFVCDGGSSPVPVSCFPHSARFLLSELPHLHNLTHLYGHLTAHFLFTMASVERMTLLAQKISENTAIITEYLTSKGLEAASFNVNGLAEFPIPQEDQVPFKARLELAAATRELHDIAVGPKEHLRDLSWQVRVARVPCS